MTEQNENAQIDASEAVVIMLVQQYAAKFGITFSSSLMANQHHRNKLVQLMGQAISGQRGAVTDADIIGDDVID